MRKIFLASLAIATVYSLEAQTKVSGINLSYIDKSADPKTDFFKYANGEWLKTTKIPDSESSWGSFNELKERNDKNLLEILEAAANNKTAKPGSNTQKIGTYYRLGMDSVKLEKDGIKPIASDLAAIDKIKSKAELVKLTASFHQKGVNPFFGFGISTDLKSSNVNAAYFVQGGTFLPDKDYYFKENKKDLRDKYASHIEKMFLLLGYKDEGAKAAATAVLKFETALAQNQMTRLEMRDQESQYNKMLLADFAKKNTNFNFNSYVLACGLKSLPKEVIVSQPKFYEGLNELIKTTSIADLKVYLKWCLIHEAAPRLNNAFVQENFNFYGTALSGAKVMKPRWKKMLSATDAAIGDALGQVFVEKYFDKEAKARLNTLVDNLFAAYRTRINTRTWMSDVTKQEALNKLNKIQRKLGFPDYWKDYTSLEIKNDAYVLNYFRANKYEYKRNIAKFGKPVDRTEWGMTPPTINAYYNPSGNEIAFPAGILQPPFFNKDADDAANYGMMGAVIGHELTHGFDDQGAKFDGDGNLKNWWTEEDTKNFEAKTQVLVKQFNACVAIDTIHVNGELTLGENIADLGGLTMAYYAYKTSLNGKKSEVIDGFTGEQRFFIAWAQGWKTTMRPEMLKQMVATNPHSPGNFRGNIPLSNMTEFYDAFSVKDGDPMFRKASERAEIW